MIIGFTPYQNTLNKITLVFFYAFIEIHIGIPVENCVGTLKCFYPSIQLK